jgi:hypothetical protein
MVPSNEEIRSGEVNLVTTAANDPNSAQYTQKIAFLSPQFVPQGNSNSNQRKAAHNAKNMAQQIGELGPLKLVNPFANQTQSQI